MIVINYCLEIIINCNNKQLNKINTLINKCAHNILGITSYKYTTSHLLSKVNWISIHHMIMYRALKLIHNISYENIPLALTQYLQFNMVRSDLAQLVRKPSLKCKYSTSKTKNSLLYRAIYIYNNLPDNIRLLPKKTFTKSLKNHLKNTYDMRNIPKIP